MGASVFQKLVRLLSTTVNCLLTLCSTKYVNVYAGKRASKHIHLHTLNHTPRTQFMVKRV